MRTVFTKYVKRNYKSYKFVLLKNISFLSSSISIGKKGTVCSKITHGYLVKKQPFNIVRPSSISNPI